ncbi:MAG: adenylosuccinate synthetase [archaeon]|nr:adenylosuccinate synthetase [archaeon]
MPQTIVTIGAQWGDEGKGIVVAELLRNADVCVRSQGGDNAGHTLYDSNGEKHVVNIAPSGTIFDHVTNVIGNGCVVNLQTLEENMNGAKGDLYISDAAHLIFEYHKLLDGAQESRRRKKIGTTKRGIGPAYVDKMNRSGIRAGLLKHPELLEEKLRSAIDLKNQELEFWGVEDRINPDAYLEKMKPLFEKYAPMVIDTRAYLISALHEGKLVIFEGAQGSNLDIDHGTYPNVTSSNTTIGGVLTGTGLSHKEIDRVIGISKVYTTRVGSGLMMVDGDAEDLINNMSNKDQYFQQCKLTDSDLEIIGSGDSNHPLYDQLVSRFIRESAEEFGATTGRPRRVGWLDLVVLRKSIEVNGLDGLILTRLDNLDGIPRIKICTRYVNKNTGEELKILPNNEPDLVGFEPEYIELKGWNSTASIRKLEDLPTEAREFVDCVKSTLGIDIYRVKNGPKQGDYVELKNPWSY